MSVVSDHWVKDMPTDEIRDRLGALKRGIAGGWLSMCRRELDEQAIRHMESELLARGAK